MFEPGYGVDDRRWECRRSSMIVSCGIRLTRKGETVTKSKALRNMILPSHQLLSKVFKRLRWQWLCHHVGKLVFGVDLLYSKAISSILEVGAEPMYLAIAELGARGVSTGIKISEGQSTIVVFPCGGLEIGGALSIKANSISNHTDQILKW